MTDWKTEPAPLEDPAEAPLEGSRLGKIGAKKMKNTEHVLIDEDGMRCHHCTDSHKPPLPMIGTAYAERLLGFVRMHRLCPKPEVPSPQLALPGTEVDLFAKMYPMARDHGALRDALHRVLTPEQYEKLPHGTVEGWHVASGIFDGAAHWARLERGHIDVAARVARGEPAIPGLTIPGRFAMPPPLAELLGEKPGKAKKKRAARS
jgi:hypothetical protein